jgi:hypothetical protein
MRSDNPAIARYLAVLLGGCALACGLIIGASAALIRHFPQKGFSEFEVLTHYSFGSVERDADIVLVGDSTLLRGVKPAIVQEETGLTVRSIPLYASAGPYAYQLLLDNYLAHNRAPRAFLFYLAPSAPILGAAHTYEKSWVLMRFGSVLEALNHDVNLFDLIRTDNRLVEEYRHRDTAGAQKMARVLEQTSGYSPASKPALQDCHFDGKAINEATAGLKFGEVPWDMTESLRRRYAARGIKTLLYVSPMPLCDVSFSFFKDRYPAAINTLTQKPNDSFFDETHMTDAGASANSREVGAALHAALSGR